MNLNKALLVLLVTALLFYPALAQANQDVMTYKSALVWRVGSDGDYELNKDVFSSPGTYEINTAYTTEGTIETITANYKFKGEVTLEVSADNGLHYIPIVNGVPLTFGFTKGNRLKWRATLSADSQLIEVRLAYTDSSGVIGTFGEPRLSGFSVRKPIYITNPSGEDLFNHQVKVEVGEGVATDDVVVLAKTEADFKDVRFTATDGQTLLGHYLEEIEGEAPNRAATFYVKVPQIPAEGLRLYLYYGNPEAEDISSGDETFDFFDDFSSSSLREAPSTLLRVNSGDEATPNTEKWQKTGTASISNGELRLEDAQLLSKTYQIKDGIIEYRAKAGAGNEIRLILRGEEDALESANQIAYSSSYEGAEHCIAAGDIVKANTPEPISAGIFYDFRVIAKGEEITFERYGIASPVIARSDPSPSLRGEAEAISPEASVSYRDTGGLTSGSICLKAGAGCTSYFDWVRVRKYSPYTVEVDRDAPQQAEQIELPDFSGIRLSGKGNLILEDTVTEGAYTSQTLSLPFNARIFVPSFVIASSDPSPSLRGEAEAISLDVSLDGGLTFAPDCAKGNFYYASKNEFTPGDELKFKLSLRANGKAEATSSKAKWEAISPQLEQISIDYRPGKILLISPSGGEVWEMGAQKEIIWTAFDYGPAYEMKLEYSLNNGQSYQVIAEAAKNDGAYSWATPDKASDKALVRISDARDSDVFDLSDSPFSISLPQEELLERQLKLIESIDVGSAKIIYPAGCDTPIKRLKYCYRLQELLRLEHNISGKNFREAGITKQAWLIYLSQKFEPRSKIVSAEIAGLRQALGYATVSQDNKRELRRIREEKKKFKQSVTMEQE